MKEKIEYPTPITTPTPSTPQFFSAASSIPTNPSNSGKHKASQSTATASMTSANPVKLNIGAPVSTKNPEPMMGWFNFLAELQQYLSNKSIWLMELSGMKGSSEYTTAAKHTPQFFPAVTSIPTSTSGSAGSQHKAPQTTATAPASRTSANPVKMNTGAFVSTKKHKPTIAWFRLPAAIQRTIGCYLYSADAAALSTTSKNTLHVLAVPMQQRKLVYYFLRRVVRGQHGLVKQMLSVDIELLCKKERVKDCSGRIFEPISGFEYALWALDELQWVEMLFCMPKDSEGHLTKKSKEVVAELKRQYDAVKTSGVLYTLKGIIKKEVHYDFSLIHALEKQLKMHNTTVEGDWDAIDKQWREEVGGAQRLCPMHVVDEYCDGCFNTSLDIFNKGPSLLEFKSRPQRTNGFRKFYNDRGWEHWFEANSKLGVYFAISQSFIQTTPHNQFFTYGAVACLRGSTGEMELVAMNALRKTRSENFRALEGQLNSLLKPTKVASSMPVAEPQHRPG